MSVQPRAIAASAIAGVRWSYLGGTCSLLCSLIVGIILARILGPKPYGQVILASTIYGFVNLFVDGGLSQALIQKRSFDVKEIRKVFFAQVLIALKATGVVYLLAPWIAYFFHDSSATRVIQAMSWMIAIQSIGLVSAALLRKRMQFKAIQCAGVASYVIAFAGMGIPLALRGAGVWSLVAAALCQCLLNAILLYSATRHSLVPGLGFPDRSMTAFGRTIVANNVVNWGHSNLDNLAAAHLGPIALGLYGRAYNFAHQPVSAVVTGLQSVLMPSVAATQGCKREIGNLTLFLMTVSLGLLGCAYAICAFIPDTTMVGLFGEKWRGLVPLMIPLAIAMPFHGIHCLLGPILCGLGKPYFEFWPQAISCVAAAFALFAAARISVLAIAWTLLGVTILRFALLAIFTFRLLEIGWGKAFLILARRICVAVAFGAFVRLADKILRSPFHLGAEPRLGILTALSMLGVGWMIWYAGEVLFGRDAIQFLLGYTDFLPTRYVKQLRIQAHRQPAPALGSSRPTEAAG